MERPLSDESQSSYSSWDKKMDLNYYDNGVEELLEGEKYGNPCLKFCEISSKRKRKPVAFEELGNYAPDVLAFSASEWVKELDDMFNKQKGIGEIEKKKMRSRSYALLHVVETLCKMAYRDSDEEEDKCKEVKKVVNPEAKIENIRKHLKMELKDLRKDMKELSLIEKDVSEIRKKMLEKKEKFNLVSRKTSSSEEVSSVNDD